MPEKKVKASGAEATKSTGVKAAEVKPKEIKKEEPQKETQAQKISDHNSGDIRASWIWLVSAGGYDVWENDISPD